MLAQGIPSRYQWLLPSTVCIVGNRSVHDAGPLDVQRSGGSVKWESVSIILIPSKELLSCGFDSTMVTVRLRWSRVPRMFGVPIRRRAALGDAEAERRRWPDTGRPALSDSHVRPDRLLRPEPAAGRRLKATDSDGDSWPFRPLLDHAGRSPRRSPDARRARLERDQDCSLRSHERSPPGPEAQFLPVTAASSRTVQKS